MEMRACGDSPPLPKRLNNSKTPKLKAAKAISMFQWWRVLQLARTIQHVIGFFSNRDSKEKVARKFYNV